MFKTLSELPKPGDNFNASVDIQRVLKNALIFFAPGFVVFLLALQAGASLDQAAYALYTWGLSTLIDFLRKYKAS